MEIKKTIEILNKKANEYKKKYPGDASQYSFFEHTLRLLSKIAKQEIEKEKELIAPMQSGEQSFKCKYCEGDGYVEEWGNTKKGEQPKVISDCDICKGEGYIIIKVIDKRKKTKNKDLYYNRDY